MKLTKKNILFFSIDEQIMIIIYIQDAFSQLLQYVYKRRGNRFLELTLIIQYISSVY